MTKLEFYSLARPSAAPSQWPRWRHRWTARLKWKQCRDVNPTDAVFRQQKPKKMNRTMTQRQPDLTRAWPRRYTSEGRLRARDRKRPSSFSSYRPPNKNPTSNDDRPQC
ncbi:hypothetical protein JX266_013785 [Neoarthrinium moseri]|nr:hypothetical protein JX266_013785 [Neoarthrinium moseri]